MSTSAQRLDIQGLRAVAVLLVVAYHLWPGRVTGGYIGVDVFFVISGYLISARLISEAETTGTVSLGDFWARRIRRLLPAAFVVLAASLVATYVLVPRSLVRQTLKEIAASTAYILNWSLGADSVDYQAAGGSPTLVQHFWTLSVEEQFYVLWPVLLFAALWVAYKRMRVTHTAEHARGVAVAVLTTTVVASFAYSVYDTYTNGASAYFSTVSRLWEFAIGGLLVFALRPSRSGRRPAGLDRPVVRAVAGWLGVALIVFSAFTFASDTAFPGWLASLPVAGGALVILASRTSERLGVGPVLSLPPARWIGDLSYSIYLWHWPLIILYPYAIGHAPGRVGAAAIFAATLVLAAATKYGVEDPLRFKARLLGTTRRAFVFMLVGGAALLGAVALYLTVLSNQYAAAQAALDEASEGAGSCYGAAAMDPEYRCPDPFAITPTVDTAHAARDAAWNFGPTAQACPTRPGNITTCRYTSGSQAQDALSVALVGDSHAEALLPAMYAAGEAAGWRSEYVIASGCPAVFLDPDGGLPAGYEGTEGHPVFGECHVWSKEVVDDLVARDDIDVVVFAFSRVYALEPAELVHQFDRVRDSGKVVVLVRDVPGIEPDVAAPECVDASAGQADPCVWQPSDAGAPMLEAWEMGEGRFGYVDLWDSFCDEEGCHAVIGGVVVYFDDEHLTITYAETLAPYLLEDIEEAIASPGVGGD